MVEVDVVSSSHPLVLHADMYTSNGLHKPFDAHKYTVSPSIKRLTEEV